MEAELDLIQQAYDALVASGRLVERLDDHHLWAVEGERQLLTDDELVDLASEHGLLDGSKRLQ